MQQLINFNCICQHHLKAFKNSTLKVGIYMISFHQEKVRFCEGRMINFQQEKKL